MPHRRSPVAAIFAAFVLLLVACSATDRPEVATWQPKWQAMVDLVPDREAMGGPPTDALCQDTLADIRSRREDLLPSPAESIDDLANEWISVAEEAFFDCPPEGQEVDSFNEAYEEMQRVEDSIKDALADAA